MQHILIGSPDQEAVALITKGLSSEFVIMVAADSEDFFHKFREQLFELYFIDITYLDQLRAQQSLSDYKKTLNLFWQIFPVANIIVLSGQEKIRATVEAVKAGASNYLTYPLDLVELKFIVDTVYESDRIESELDYFRSSFWLKDFLSLVQTHSPSMKKVYSSVMAVAPTKTTVLLTGETGTGKGVISKLIHSHSNRKDNIFISVNCGAMAENLLESELFGHEKGAFTGALKRKLGKFEISSGGTIFLDEIGTISPSAQVKLLHVLQEKSFQRVGGNATLESDVRIIAATNMDLKKMCDEGLFRKDLYYRLNVFPIEIPPLRERSEDIDLLANTFLESFNRLHTKNIRGIAPEVIEALKKYPWPGNIREMEHLFERAFVLEKGPVLSVDSFPIELFTSDALLTPIPVNALLPLAEARSKAVDDFQTEYLQELLTRNCGRIKQTAQAAEISTRQLHKLMKKYGLDKKNFR
jgi:DNA-binding NtrC family response regulator